MALIISRATKVQLLAWAVQAHPVECCGLIFGDKSQIEEVELVVNISTNPRTSFEIEPAALLAAEKRDRAGERFLMGYFHSHPNGAPQPSDTDAAMASTDGRYWLIVARDDVTAWRFESDSKFKQYEMVTAD
ncbi:MAG: M67 family metallopeptidase [Sphingorhabdus sp.]